MSATPLTIAITEAGDTRDDTGDHTAVDRVGGKAAGLGRLVRAGERVPDGFCLTTDAYKAARAEGRMPEQVRAEIVEAYERLGGCRVAVRSSATTEDLEFASFAGQHETVLDVEGTDSPIDAVHTCWESLHHPRAVAYRESAGVEGTLPSMGVVVQRMVDAAFAGVLFTANPLTGTRTEMVVDAVAGRGDVVVDGSAPTDHYVFSAGAPPQEAGGCLNAAQLDELRQAGLRIQRHAGSPQDIEWAFDHDVRLWILQSRSITTLFPLPPASPSDPRALFEAGHMQGMLRPFTPMGMSVLQLAMVQWLESVGVKVDPKRSAELIVDIAGRMYLDLTPVLRSSTSRENLPAAMMIYGPRVSASVEVLLADPRFAATTRWPFRIRTMAPVVVRVVPPLVAGMLDALIRLEHARRQAWAVAAQMQELQPSGELTARERVQWAFDHQMTIMQLLTRMLSPLYAAYAAKGIASRLLEGITQPGEVDETLRGMPHNVTTQMDLELWQLARAAGERDDVARILRDTPPAELAARYLAGTLPDIGLAHFLQRYGHRGAAEIDVGVPRWAEDPAPVFAAIAGYLRVTGTDDAPDRRFARAAQEATATIEALVTRARTARPLRARAAGFFLRRSRALAGMRELPKFAWLYTFEHMRTQLLEAGAELERAGLLNRADDIMFLDVDEARAAADGADLRERIAERRTVYAREMRRRSVPGLVLSDGTMPEALAPRTPAPDGALLGMAAAAGRVTGRAHIVHDPASARLEPGEILVAATTDPGWTPLFLTAGGLVTETGSPMAHGPTVAREYGIPAVICVKDATTLLADGQLLTIDGSAGTVVIEEEPAVPAT